MPTAKKIKSVSLNRRTLRQRLREQAMKLKKDEAIPLTAIAEEWGMDDSQVRTTAHHLKVAAYCDVGDGRDRLCLVHPETAAKHKA